MNIASDDAIVLGRKLAVALAAGIPAVSVIGVWLLARFTNTFDAYAGERAKLQVQFDNVEKLVRQTEALTTATASIQTKLSGDLWLRQQRWSQRLDGYVQAIDALELLRDKTLRLHSESLKPRPDYLPVGQPDALNTAIVEFTDAYRNFGKMHNLCRIVSSQAAFDVLEALEIPDLSLDALAETSAEIIRRISKAIVHLVFAARQDLGYEAIKSA